MKVKLQKVSYTPVSKGMHRAVCCEVADRGIVETRNGRKHQLHVVYQVEQRVEDQDSDFFGQRKELRRVWNVSLHEKSKMRQDLETWRGKPLTAEELEEGFETDNLVGVSAIVWVKDHSDPAKDKMGRVFANIGAILPPIGTDGVNGEAFALEPENYVPLAERGGATDFPPADEEEAEAASAAPAGSSAPPATLPATASKSKAPF